MRQNRYLPFGYAMEDGECVLHEVESVEVKWIFSQYISGLYLSEIAQKMTAKGVPYTVGKSEWNKNMVSRILENSKYIGNEKYPTIISEEHYELATDIKNRKKENAIKGIANPTLKDNVYCTQCGQHLFRETRAKEKYKWNCQNNDCKTKKRLIDSQIISQVIELLNKLIGNPDTIKIPSADVQFMSIEITRLQNEINREIDKRDSDDSKVKALIMQCAIEKYTLCDDGSKQQAWERIKAIAEKGIPITTDIFENIISKVFVDTNGNASIELQNGQII